MNFDVMKICVVPLLLALSACSTSQRVEHAMNTQLIDSEVRLFLKQYLQTLEGGDEEAIRRLYVDDERFMWFSDGAVSYRSPDDVLNGLNRFASIKFHTDISDVEVVPLTPAYATASTGFSTELEIPGAENYTFGGVITFLLERDEASGRWAVLRGHTSTPGGPPDDE